MSNKIIHTDNKTILHTSKNTPISQVYFTNKSVSLIHNGPNKLIYSVGSPQLLEYDSTNPTNTRGFTFKLEFVITQTDILRQLNVIEFSFNSGANLTIAWKPTVINNLLKHTYSQPGTYQVEISGTATSFGNIIAFPYRPPLGWIGIELLTRVIDFGSLGITDYSNAFYGARNLLSVPNDPTFSANVTNMTNMFNDAVNFNSDISNWNVSKVTNMRGMFNGAYNFNSNISKWNVSKVTDMSFMFIDAHNFNSDLSKWNVSNVTEMNSMFAGAFKFESNLSGWNVSNVTDMNSMFFSATKFNSDLSKWNVSNVSYMSDIFTDCALTFGNWDKILLSWSNLNVKSGVTVSTSVFHSNLPVVNDAFNKLKSKGWTIYEIKPMKLEFVITQADITAKTNIIELPFNSNAILNIKWGGSNTSSLFPYTYEKAGTYPVEIGGPAKSFGNYLGWVGVKKLTRVIDFGSLGITDYVSAFQGATNLISVPNDPIFSANVTYMDFMFKAATKINSDISKWDVSKVISMRSMFGDAQKFNSNLSNWNVSSVINMSFMFFGATNFNSDISKWNVSKVTDMNNMFSVATNFNSDISKWNVSNVTNMSRMFYKATKFNLDLSNWNVSKVTTMEGMFTGSALSVDNWNKILVGWSKLNVRSGVNISSPVVHSDRPDVNNAFNILKSKGWIIREGVRI